MKFACFGYINEMDWNKLPENEQTEILKSYFKFYEQLKNENIFLGGTGLKGATEAAKISLKNGVLEYLSLQPDIEQIGGYFIIEANNIDEAKSIISKHPGLKVGSFEIRAVDDEITKLVGAE